MMVFNTCSVYMVPHDYSSFSQSAFESTIIVECKQVAPSPIFKFCMLAFERGKGRLRNRQHAANNRIGCVQSQSSTFSFPIRLFN